MSERSLGELLRVVVRAAEGGDEQAASWLRGEGYIQVYKDRSEFLRFDGADGRTGPQSTAWSRAVRKRDGYRCRRCGADDKLQAHHVKGWAEHPELRFDLDNGETVCVECHAIEHPKQANLIRKSKYQKRRKTSSE